MQDIKEGRTKIHFEMMAMPIEDSIQSHKAILKKARHQNIRKSSMNLTIYTSSLGIFFFS